MHSQLLSTQMILQLQDKIFQCHYCHMPFIRIMVQPVMSIFPGIKIIHIWVAWAWISFHADLNNVMSSDVPRVTQVQYQCREQELSPFEFKCKMHLCTQCHNCFFLIFKQRLCFALIIFSPISKSANVNTLLSISGNEMLKKSKNIIDLFCFAQI